MTGHYYLNWLVRSTAAAARHRPEAERAAASDANSEVCGCHGGVRALGVHPPTQCSKTASVATTESRIVIFAFDEDTELTVSDMVSVSRADRDRPGVWV